MGWSLTRCPSVAEITRSNATGGTRHLARWLEVDTHGLLPRRMDPFHAQQRLGSMDSELGGFEPSL